MAAGPMRYPFKTAEFLKTGVKQEHYPVLRHSDGSLYPEVAVAGRSNVGKSTLLNLIFRRRNLVRTSSTPGKTQELQFFLVDDALSFCDLPGYGYAKVPPKIRAKWGPMIQGYLESRESLRLILHLIDIRRTPNEEDIRFLNWCIKQNKSVLLILTKVDKVTKGEKEKNTKRIHEKLGFDNLHTVHFSATKNVGREKLIALINEAIEDEINGPTE